MFYLAGPVFMVLGASGLVARLTVGWTAALRVVAAVVVSPVIFWGTFTLADAVIDAIAGPDAGWWWPGEGAIAATGLLFAATGALHSCAGRRYPPQPDQRDC